MLGGFLMFILGVLLLVYVFGGFSNFLGTAKSVHSGG